MKRLLYLFAALSFGSLAVPLIHATLPTPFDLPVGDWNVDANGTKGILHIGAVVNGTLQGSTIFGNPIVGLYDSTAARISFIRLLGVGISQQVYTGYLFREPSTPFVFSFSLTGEFQAYSNIPAERSVFGWYATHISHIIIIPPTPVPVPNPVLDPGPVH
jgi:hypothetical protein